MSSARFKLRRRNAVVGGGGSSFTVTGNGFGDTYFATGYPLLADTKVMRSFRPTQNESDIGIAEECGPYRSPPADHYLVTGPDVNDFEASPVYNGYIRFKASVIAAGVRKNRTLQIAGYRTGLGWGNTATVIVGMTANATDEHFVSISAADQSGDGSWAAPWKYMPGSADSTVTGVTLRAGQCVFIKGETHNTTLCPSKTDGSSRLPHHGDAGNVSYTEMNGWGSGPAGRAIFTGDLPITGTPTAPTQSQAGGNSLYASLKMVTGQTYVEDYMLTYCGPDQLYEVAWPTPENLRFHEGVDYVSAVGSEKFGTRNYPVQKTGGTRRMYTDGPSADGSGGSVTTITVVDPDFATIFGSIPSATLAASGIRGLYRYYSNFFIRMPLISYDQATSTMVFDAAGAILSSSEGFGSFGLRNHPSLFAKAGQVYYDPNHTTIMWWQTNAGTVSISRMVCGVSMGNSGYWTHRGGQFQRFCSGVVHGGGGDKSCGVANFYQGSGVQYGCDMINGWYMQCNNPDSGIGVFNLSGATGAGMAGTNLMLNYMVECNGFSGFRFKGLFNGLSTVSDNDWAGLEATTVGIIAYNSMGDYGIEGTWFFSTQSRGLYLHHNIVINHTAIHGNGYSPYDIDDKNRMILIKYCLHANASRFFTSQRIGTDGYFHKIESCIVLNPPNQGAAVQLNSGGFEFNLNRCFMLGHGTRTPYLFIVYFQGGGTNMAISNSVLAGLKEGTAGQWTGALSNIVVTIDLSSFSIPANSTLGGTKTNVTQYNGTTKPYRPNNWDEVFTTDDKAIMGLGDIGAFHKIAA